jgi:hypothetical protein
MMPDRGTHYRAVYSELSREKTEEVLSALKNPDVLAALKKNPINSIAIGRTGNKLYPAEYDWHDKAITINSARKLGVHYGEEFRPGTAGNMSAATSDKTESMRRSLLQESAHHFQNVVPGVADSVNAAFADASKQPITRYAGTSAEEYFAESFVAFMVDPEALAENDPVGGKMVKQAMAMMRKRK